MQVLSLTWGILALIGMLVAFFPCLGALNWLNVPFSAVGLIISAATVATTKSESKGTATAGLICCVVAVILGIARLMLGGGVF